VSKPGRAARSDDAQLGRNAAQLIAENWPDTNGLTEHATAEFAAAAVERLAELIGEQPALFQASRRGSEKGAESLSARPFQGIVESIQNGDDLDASELRLALRLNGPGRELLIVHNGAPISLVHVAAMVLPWVTTKADDPGASGRFGIGQKTLRALGGPIDAHCTPYHFRMDEVPTTCPPEPPIDGFYDPAARETLLVVPLYDEVDAAVLEQFIADLGTRALVFLRSIRRVVLIDLPTGAALVDHQLHERPRRGAKLHVHGHNLEVEVVELTDRTRAQTYVRYLAEMPLRPEERRHNKATGPTTTLGVSVPRQPEQGLLYDRLPLPIPCELPVGLNAQFDPDTARSTLHERSWNAHRFAELGDFAAAVAVELFDRDARRAWEAVPLLHEVPSGIGEWLRERFLVDVIGRCHLRLGEELRLGPKEEPRALDEIVFEDAGLESVLTGSDQERLADGFSAVPPSQRDRRGRWRSVLQELGRSRLIDVGDALDLLALDDAELGERQPRWYLAFAAAAIEAGRFYEFCGKRGTLLADGTRVAPPRPNEPRSLVIDEEPQTLASELGLTLTIHGVYLGSDEAARRVRGALEAERLLVRSYDSNSAALELLARGIRNPIRLEDTALLALRDAFERLSEDDQRERGPRIGRAILLRGFRYDSHGKTEALWVSPRTAYLPAQIDRETGSFARAAAKSPKLCWVSADYRQLLKRAGGRRELGPQRLLARLGVQTFPRLVPPPNELQRYARDPRLASPIEPWRTPDIQQTELHALSQRTTHLINDRWSPDLDAVIENIKAERAGASRRRRAAALLSLLARGWERQFAEHVTAQAVWGYDGYWYDRGEVIATWLARAASEPWLPSATGALSAPLDLHIPSEANRLTIGSKRSLYLMAVDNQVLRSPVLAALRIRRGPSASSVVAKLEELRDDGKVGAAIEEQTRTAYRILALACSPDGRGRRPVDDMTVAQLRSHFAGGARGKSGSRGLLLIKGRWYAPEQALIGPPIFGRRRPFVASSSSLEPLWQMLQIPLPDARECVAVLREIAGDGPLADSDRSVIIETMRALAPELTEATPQLRASMRTLPVWTGAEWTAHRPVYAISDDAIASAVADQARIWQPGFAIDHMEPLIDALGLTLIGVDQFVPVADAGYGAAIGEEFRPRFVLAVEHLRTELARGDQTLYQALTVTWEELAATQLVFDSDLEVAANVAGGRQLVAPTTAHLLRRPLTLFARSADDVGSAGGGGRAIAELFNGDRQKVAWAWVAMWLKADSGLGAQKLLLSSDVDTGEADDDRLTQLRTQADDRRTRKGKTAKKPTARATTNSASGVKVRQLKQIEKLEPSQGTIVNQGAPRGGIIVPLPRKPTTVGRGGPSRTGATTGGTTGETTTGTGTPGSPSVLPPMSAREQLAYDAVIAALALDEGQVADLRQRRGVGADAIDELRQWFEIKMSSSSEIPNEITLTPSEVERARTDPDFFLAIVAGLEEGAGELRVRFIFDPLARLPLRLRSDLTFGGVRDAEALEYVYPRSSPPAESDRAQQEASVVEAEELPE
jgi:hypothetical protein